MVVEPEMRDVGVFGHGAEPHVRALALAGIAARAHGILRAVRGGRAGTEGEAEKEEESKQEEEYRKERQESQEPVDPLLEACRIFQNLQREVRQAKRDKWSAQMLG